MGRLDRIGIASPLAGFVRPDSKHSAQYAFWITQSGLGLPDRDYYLSDDARLAGFRTKYREHVEKMLHLLGVAGPGKEADKIIALETAIAKTAVDTRGESRRAENLQPENLGATGTTKRRRSTGTATSPRPA